MTQVFLSSIKIIAASEYKEYVSRNLLSESKIASSLLDALGQRLGLTRKKGETMDEYG